MCLWHYSIKKYRFCILFDEMCGLLETVAGMMLTMFEPVLQINYIVMIDVVASVRMFILN